MTEEPNPEPIVYRGALHLRPMIPLAAFKNIVRYSSYACICRAAAYSITGDKGRL